MTMEVAFRSLNIIGYKEARKRKVVTLAIIMRKKTI